MEKVISYKCPSCDAPLSYDGKEEKLLDLPHVSFLRRL